MDWQIIIPIGLAIAGFAYLVISEIAATRVILAQILKNQEREEERTKDHGETLASHEARLDNFDNRLERAKI